DAPLGSFPGPAGIAVSSQRVQGVEALSQIVWKEPIQLTSDAVAVQWERKGAAVGKKRRLGMFAHGIFRYGVPKRMLRAEECVEVPAWNVRFRKSIAESQYGLRAND